MKKSINTESTLTANAIIRDLLKAVEMLMPGLRYIPVESYQILNDAPIRAREFLQENSGSVLGVKEWQAIDTLSKYLALSGRVNDLAACWGNSKNAYTKSCGRELETLVEFYLPTLQEYKTYFLKTGKDVQPSD